MLAVGLSLFLCMSSAALAGTRTPAGEEYATPPQIGNVGPSGGGQEGGGQESVGQQGSPAAVESALNPAEVEGLLSAEEVDDGVLPFTGQDLVLVVGIGLGLIVLGFALRRVGRRGAG